MKKLMICLMISMMCIFIANCVVQADELDDEFHRVYGDYYDNFYKQHGYNSYEEYAEDYNNWLNGSKNNYSNNDEEDVDVDDYEDYDDEEINKNNKSKNKKTSNTSNNQINHTFVGKTKEECAELDFLYRKQYYLKPRLDDFCSPSIYHLDDTKTVYYYPVINENNYKSFWVLNSDTLSTNDTSGVVYLNFCQFLLNEDGTWSDDLILPNTYRDDDEKNKASNMYNTIILDTALLYDFEDRKPEPKPIISNWYVHFSADNQYFSSKNTTLGNKFGYVMLTKNSSNKYYVYNRDKLAEEQSKINQQQRLSKLGFQYDTQLSDYAIAFDDALQNYMQQAMSMVNENPEYAKAVLAGYQSQLKAYYDTLSSVIDAYSYNSEYKHDVNVAKGMLNDARKMFTFLR